jgi:DNA mismatch repair protein MutL
LSGIIKLLSDAVANQIAAGEVVQRPASAVKELLENSIDAGATEVKLLIKDGGSTLMQVIDNGKGMSETDARLCWERHATSKIRKAQDLFSLNTYGFRGEALASIAAVAQVEMKTRRPEDSVATYIRIEGSEVLDVKIESAPIGTSISIKNLFYNIPARRNFLKSIAVETKHIFEEFQRQALANPNIAFKLYNNGNEIFNFPIRPLKDRIAGVLGIKDPENLIDFAEDTEISAFNGFLGKPEKSRKTRGDQYFFVNNRFIKSPYFHHAVMQAYDGQIEPESYPLYVIFINVSPDKVDVNVHPTKTEVKFEDEKHIYNLLKVSVKKALGQSILPTSDGLFDIDNFSKWSNNLNNSRTSIPSSQPKYNPFGNSNPTNQRFQNQDWQKILGPIDPVRNPNQNQSLPPKLASAFNQDQVSLIPQDNSLNIQGFFQHNERFLVASLNNHLYLIDIKLARQHILFNQFQEQLAQHKSSSQQLLFPKTLEFQPSKMGLLLELMDEFKFLGFDLGHFGGNTIIINGIPPQINGNEEKIIEKMIDDYEITQGDLKLSKNDSLALSLSRLTTQNHQLNQTESEYLIKELFSLPSFQYTFDGKTICVHLNNEILFDLFKRK